MANEADMAMAKAKGKNAAALAADEREATSPPKNKVCVYHRKPTDQTRKEDIITSYREKVVKERRKHERYYTSTMLIYKRNSTHKVTKTINLSLGGAKISSDLKLPLHQTLEIILILGNKAHQLKGDVVYSKKAEGVSAQYCTGLSFKGLPSEGRRALEDYFASLSEKKSSLTQ